MARELAIVLSGGGVNSAVSAAMAQQKYRLVMLYAEMPAEPNPRRRAAHEQQVAHFKPYREHVISLTSAGGGKFSTEAAAAANDPRQSTILGPGLLEMLPMIAASAQYAAHYQAVAIYLGLRVGAGADDLAQATEYIQIWNEMIQLPCGRPEVELVAPLLELEPWQVVDVGFQVGAPFERAWSCMENGEQPCWACRGCRAREAAFHRGAHADPLRVKK
jgi:7-cyano-7-deazaguanine synthase in queuosine biosynthesis